MYRLLTLLAFVAATPALAYDFRPLIDAHIEPAYRYLAEQTAALHEDADRYCAAPSETELADLKRGYQAAFLAWQGAQHLRFGPIKYLTREHRYALWPDKRGTVGKHLARLRDDPALAADDFDISQKSVAIQGFSALERLIYADTPPDDTDCRIVTAITANLASMSQSLYEDWFSGDAAFAHFVATPGPGNNLYAEDRQLAAELLNSLHTELELIGTQKLGNPLGSGPERARGRRAEAWRSELATPSIRANLEASLALYQVVFAPALQDDAPHQALDSEINLAFNNALETAASSDASLAKTIETREGYAWASRLQREISVIRNLVTRDLAQALALPIGFNSLDGD